MKKKRNYSSMGKRSAEARKKKLGKKAFSLYMADLARKMHSKYVRIPD